MCLLTLYSDICICISLYTVIFGQLKDLGELLKQGVLTKEEFEEQKQLLLIDLRNIK